LPIAKSLLTVPILLSIWLAASPALADGNYTDGSPDLKALKGKVVYVDFWASWCLPCRESFPWMNELQRRLGKEGLEIIAVNLDQVRGDADAFLLRFAPAFHVAFDPKGALAEKYHVRGMPTSVLLDRDGRTVFVHEGFRSKERNDLEQQIVNTLRQARGSQ
jgi:thiol-disulfide isomerase/thioredoxin